MAGLVPWCDEFGGIYRMNPTIGRELRGPVAMMKSHCRSTRPALERTWAAVCGLASQNSADGI